MNKRPLRESESASLYVRNWFSPPPKKAAASLGIVPYNCQSVIAPIADMMSGGRIIPSSSRGSRLLKRRKPKVGIDKAISLAEVYLSRQDLKGWRFEVAEAQRHPVDPANWTVIVDRFSPEGGLVDGPQILIVNGETGEVRTFEDFY